MISLKRWPLKWAPRSTTTGRMLASQSPQFRPHGKSFSTTAEEEDFVDFGSYEVILPEEPFVFGVSHIRPRNVPEHILKPPYALTADGMPEQTPRANSGKIKLGGEAESRIREAALLAKKVREFAGNQVKVSTATIHCDTKTCLTI
jgi:methionyl aminopeptidase